MDSLMGDDEAFSSASTSPDRPLSQGKIDAFADTITKEVDQMIAMAEGNLPATPPSSPSTDVKKKDAVARTR